MSWFATHDIHQFVFREWYGSDKKCGLGRVQRQVCFLKMRLATMLRRLFAHHFLNLFLCRYILAQLFFSPPKRCDKYRPISYFCEQISYTFVVVPLAFEWVDSLSRVSILLFAMCLYGLSMFYLPLRWISFLKVDISWQNKYHSLWWFLLSGSFFHLL